MPHDPLAHDLLVLRHGETEWNRKKRMQGGLDSPLTDLGRAQAAEQGRLLAGLDLAGYQWFSSPQGRARETARIAADLQDTPPDIEFDPRLAEIGIGHWTGARKAEIQAIAPQLFAKGDRFEWYDHAPAGEGIDGLAARCAAFLADLVGPAVVMTHGVTSRVLRCLAMGRDPQDFSQVDGGQGVVFRLCCAKQEKLHLQDPTDLR